MDEKRRKRSLSDSEEEDSKSKHHHSSKKDKKHKKEKKQKKDKKEKKHKKDKKEKSTSSNSSKSPISEEDYYAKAAEFRTWLLETKKLYFEDIDTEQARSLFQVFVSKWNEGSLASKFISNRIDSCIL